MRGPTVTGGGVRSAGPDGRQQVDIQGQGFVNIEIKSSRSLLRASMRFSNSFTGIWAASVRTSG
ncbi:MAG: hypothetical protein ACLT38_04880 [Akkermansia sp.]